MHVLVSIARCHCTLHSAVGHCIVSFGTAWCCQALHGAAGHCMVLLGIAQCHRALHGAIGHCTVPLSTARCHRPLHSAARQCTVPSGTARCCCARRGSVPSIARRCQTPCSTTRHRRGQERATLVQPGHPPSASPVPVPVPMPAARQPRRGQPRLCRQRRIVLGARSPCPADGRYNKAACCGQANYLSNYDLPLNHMIFLQSCGQLKPG